MANIESNVSKRTVRSETDAFLTNVTTQGNNTLRRDSMSDLIQALGTTAPDPFLTGALSATLPMKFSIPDAKGNGLVFTMLINPNTMNHGKTNTIQASYTRNGYVTQMGGPNQDLITSTGVTAAFMVEGEGLTAVARRRSFGFLNFMALMGAYRNNGYNFLDPTSLNNAMTRVIKVIHGVEMYYDGQMFMGHFNNFTVDESSDRPFSFGYSFEFVVSSLSSNYNEVKGHFIPQTGGLSNKASLKNSLVDPLTGSIQLDTLQTPTLINQVTSIGSLA